MPGITAPLGSSSSSLSFRGFLPCASLSASISALSCWSYDDLKYTEEAHIFADQQKNVKKLTPYETFIAHVEAGDAKQAII